LISFTFFSASARFGFRPSSKRTNRKTHPLKTAPSEGHRFVICENYHCIKKPKKRKTVEHKTHCQAIMVAHYPRCPKSGKR